MPGRRRGQRRGGFCRGGWFLEPVLLLLLHRGPAHGYTLIDQLRAFGLEDLHPSVAYRVLREMDEKDWVSSSWDVDETQGPPRRVYRLAALGNEMLGAYVQDLKQTHDRIGALIDAYHRHLAEGEGEHH